MAYRCVATSVAGFIQQLAVGYVARGYYFYVTGRIPDHKDPAHTDAEDHRAIRHWRFQMGPGTAQAAGPGQRALPALRGVLRHHRQPRRTAVLRRRGQAIEGHPGLPDLFHGVFHRLPAKFARRRLSMSRFESARNRTGNSKTDSSAAPSTGRWTSSAASCGPFRLSLTRRCGTSCAASCGR